MKIGSQGLLKLRFHGPSCPRLLMKEGSRVLVEYQLLGSICKLQWLFSTNHQIRQLESQGLYMWFPDRGPLNHRTGEPWDSQQHSSRQWPR